MKLARTKLQDEPFYFTDDLTVTDLNEKRRWREKVSQAYEKGVRYRFYNGRWRDGRGRSAERELIDKILPLEKRALSKTIHARRGQSMDKFRTAQGRSVERAIRKDELLRVNLEFVPPSRRPRPCAAPWFIQYSS
ncbi:hypothetical protein Bbelb_112420 [Branchiostoma belcheri]|nr:hypothetical protein Bbelb_112420 [Branchiostoma belcheri]